MKGSLCLIEHMQRVGVFVGGFFLELFCFFDLLTPEVDQILAELVMLSSNYDIIITLMVFPWWHSTSPLSQ